MGYTNSNIGFGYKIWNIGCGAWDMWSKISGIYLEIMNVKIKLGICNLEYRIKYMISGIWDKEYMIRVLESEK